MSAPAHPSLPTPRLAKVLRQPPLIASPKASMNAMHHQPNGIANLQCGERYQAMDYALLTLRRTMQN
ncbi:hypothetical protein C8J57DRAFT_1518391 [Mycena rebaudengoi]|nr:hypothetical protein C8J57DRAFT_1518391 [Mycena rebaudengoi]